MNGTREALKIFNELTNDVETLLNGIENMPRPMLDYEGNIVNYDDTYLNDYDKLDEFIYYECDKLYEKYENVFSFFKVDYDLQKNGKYKIIISAKIVLDKYYDGYGKLDYYNEFNN